MVSTGRLHGFESLAEQRLLLVLDFLGEVTEVTSQPMRLRFATDTGTSGHIPDFLVVTRTGTLLLDVRPAGRIGDNDRVKFAASGEAALACGWQYMVVTGWRPHVLTVVDALSAQRRPLADPMGIQDELLHVAATSGPLPFGALTGASSYPVLGRAHALHLLWHRRLGADLGQPLGDQALVWLSAGAARR